jgi:zinc transport system substrate-binding protein
MRQVRHGWPRGSSAVLLLATLAVPAQAAAPKVVVTIKPVHALAAGVMAGVATPVLIVDGAASPHTFTLKPSAAKAIHEADVFVRVSAALEPFTGKLAEVLPASVTLMTLSNLSGVALLNQRTGGTFEQHEHGHDHGGPADHDGDDAAQGARDGHIWLDTANAKIIVRALADVLSAKSPEYADRFKANAAALDVRIGELETAIAAELTPVKGKPFIVFHDATQYFERRFGLEALGSITVSPEVQPSVKRLSAVRKKIGELGAACVFAEPGFQPNLVAAVTEGTSARSGTLDPEGMTLSPGPELYFDLMMALAHNLKSCLAAGG